MGLTYAEIELSNAQNLSLEPVTVRALVDTGAITLCIPQQVALQLELREIEKREVTTADGSARLVPYVGPARIRFANRSCFVGAFVLGDTVLMGAIPMQDMDLVISPSGETVTVNPKSPNFPQAIVM